MSTLDTGPKASSTAIKPPANERFYGEQHKNTINDTFSSMFSDELIKSDLVKKTSVTSYNKNNTQMESLYSSVSGQSSLGILEIDNMSDIGNIGKKETFSFNTSSSQPVLLHRLSQANQTRNTLARASSIRNNIFNKSTVNDKSIRTSLSNMSNAFGNMLKEEMNMSKGSFSSEDFMSGSKFMNNLDEIEEVNRKEFGSLSESRFNFSIEGEKQCTENKSFAAKYFAAKSLHVEDLSIVFPKRQNNNKTFMKEKNSVSVLDDDKENQEKPTPIGYQTMPSITSWTDSHVSCNVLNSTSLSNISDILTSKTNLVNPKELTEALLSGNLSIDKQLNESNKFLQRRFSTSTRFSNASQNLEHAKISFPSLESLSFITPEKQMPSIDQNRLKPNNSICNKKEDDNGKIEECINATTHHTKINEKVLSNNFDKKQMQIHMNNNCNFILTPKNGYFEDCTSEPKILENNIDLSNFSIMTNNHDVFTEMSLHKSINVSKIIHSNETLCQDRLNQSCILDNKSDCEVLEIGDICIGTYSQAVITLENCLNIEANYTLHLLSVSLDNTKMKMFDENKSVASNIATVLCTDKTCAIPALSEASFTIGIIPLVSGNISVHIKLKSNDISQEINRKIQIYSIEPQITWVNNPFGSIDFGLLPELAQKSLPIKLLNKGNFQVPIKFILNQNQCEDIIQAKAIINPSELWQCDLSMLTSYLPKNCGKKKFITGRLQVVLDVVEELSANYTPLLHCSNLSGFICLTSISFNQNPLVLKKNIHSTFNGVIEISNNSELPISLFVRQNSKQCSELTIQPNKFQLNINESIKMKIVYTPTKSLNNFNKTICLQVEASQKQFYVTINCIEPNFELQQISSPSSRPTSPWSTSASSAVGHLELESTSSSLIWGSIPSNTKSIQTFTLRNRGSHKEKLLLTIRDNKNCFKLISPGENHVSEMKLLLEPMESQKLTVALISTSNEGQVYGQIIIQRLHSIEKRVISLYGYCGHSVVIIHGVLEDNSSNMWLYPNFELMTAQFSVTNTGNTTAFVKIGQEHSSEDIIQPNELILKRGETAKIEVTVIMSSERLEMLIEQNSNSKVITINKLSLIYGDEVSRVRISRLWSKIKNEKKIVYPDQQRLDEISKMFNGNYFVNVDCLADSEKSLFKLWKMGISENNIKVLMEKSNLESLLCDTTTIFNELETTVINRQY